MISKAGWRGGDVFVIIPENLQICQENYKARDCNGAIFLLS